MDVLEQMRATIEERGLAGPDNPVLLMVSGGSDSTALAYAASDLRAAGVIGELAMLHVNHKLRGGDAESDAQFVSILAEVLEIPLFMCEIDIAREAALTGGNVEAVARRERYAAASEALRSHCHHHGAPVSQGRIFTAHTADDRLENFYMRSIVGTGPGGFRSMRYRNDSIARPLMDVERGTLRCYLEELRAAGRMMVCDARGCLWCEDATNAHIDRFRAYVRHEIVPRAKERNGQLAATLCRTMNLIADEDDMLEDMANELVARSVEWLETCEGFAPDYDAGCVLLPEFGSSVPVPLQRRACFIVLQGMLGADARIESASVEAVLAAFSDGAPASGYVTNIQGNLAVSANKRGVRIEPMAAFRARRKRD